MGKRVKLVGIFLLLGISTLAQDPALLKYAPGDWITFLNCNFVTSLTDSPEYIFFGTSGGVIPFHKYRKEWEYPYTVSDGLGGNHITAVLYDSSTDILWAANDMGLSYLRAGSSYWRNIPLSEYNLSEKTPIDLLAADQNYVYCQAGPAYSFKIDKLAGFFLGYENPGNRVRWAPNLSLPLPELADYFIDPGFIWKTTGVISDKQFRDFPITVYYVDKESDVYGGTWGAGIFSGDFNVKMMELYHIGPANNNINALDLMGESLWMGGLESGPVADNVYSGISVFNLTENRWDYFEKRFLTDLVSEEVLTIDHNEREVWVGTREGIAIYDRKRNKWGSITVFDGLVSDYVLVIRLADSLAWVGTDQGLHYIEIPSRNVHRFVLSSSSNIMPIYDLAVDSSRVWVACSNGLFAVNRYNFRIEHFNIFGERIPVEAQSAGEVTAVEVSGNKVYAVSRDRLLILEEGDSSAKWKVVSIPNVAISFQVNDLAADSRFIWLASSSGLYLYSLSRKMWYQFSTQDGLPSNQIQVLELADDELWIGTNNGLSRFYWKDYVQN